MQVSSYLFQSPYSQPVQVGRPDPVQEQKQAAEEETAKSKDETTKSVQAQTPDPIQERKRLAEENAAKTENIANSQPTKKSQEEATLTLYADGVNKYATAKSSTMYQDDISSKSTFEAVNSLIAAAKDANRSDNINTYMSAEQSI